MARYEIFPTPKKLNLTDQRVRIDESWGMRAGEAPQDVAGRYARLFNVPARPAPKNIELLADKSLGAEAYRLEISAESLRVWACERRGFLRALSTLVQLRDGPFVPQGTVEDWPRLNVRGIQFMLEGFKQMDAPEAHRMLDLAGRLKLNTVLIEFGDRFPFRKHAAIVSPNTLSRNDVKELVAHAHELGITPVPLLQSLGHLEYLLRHEQYTSICENPAVRTQICPIDPNSVRVWTELAEEMLELFPGCKLMHIGADETRELGATRSAEACKQLGKGGLFAGHINQVCRWLLDRGITPILWDDMLCTHPEAMAMLEKDAWLMYWDYWTTSHPSPLIVAREQKARHPRQGVEKSMYDQRWNREWAGELSDVTRAMLRHYASAVDLAESLDEPFMKEFGSYLGEYFPKYVPAFPYLQYYLDKGRTVIGAPTCSGNRSTWNGLPDFPRFAQNIKTFADRCIETKAEGMLTTAWYNRIPEVLVQGMILTAEFTW